MLRSKIGIHYQINSEVSKLASVFKKFSVKNYEDRIHDSVKIQKVFCGVSFDFFNL